MTKKDERFGFDRFAELDFYKNVNRKLVESVDLSFADRVIDLACGTGQMTKQITDRLQKSKDKIVIGIDRSQQALSDARNSVKDTRQDLVKFVQGSIENLSEVLSEPADAAFLGNAIHYIDRKQELIRSVSQNLNPGGMFAFNTSFFEGGQPAEARTFYRRWMMQALRYLRREHDISTDRDKKVESRKHLTSDEYETLLEDEDFEEINSELIPVDMPIKGWEAISEYRDFIQGALPGVTLDIGSQALKQALWETTQKLDIDTVPRNWLQVIARKGNR